MDILKIKNYSISEDLILRNSENTLMVYNKECGDMYEINDVGRDIFEKLMSLKPISLILHELSEEYDVVVDDIIVDVTEFVLRMIDLGIITIES